MENKVNERKEARLGYVFDPVIMVGYLGIKIISNMKVPFYSVTTKNSFLGSIMEFANICSHHQPLIAQEISNSLDAVFDFNIYILIFLHPSFMKSFIEAIQKI